jgi:hypothetical protein
MRVLSGLPKVRVVIGVCVPLMVPDPENEIEPVIGTAWAGWGRIVQLMRLIANSDRMVLGSFNIIYVIDCCW